MMLLSIIRMKSVLFSFPMATVMSLLFISPLEKSASNVVLIDVIRAYLLFSDEFDDVLWD